MSIIKWAFHEPDTAKRYARSALLILSAASLCGAVAFLLLNIL